MTDAQAQEEAERRWGHQAVAKFVTKDVGGRRLFGYFVSDCTCARFCWLGLGETWEAAFMDADRRLAEWREQAAPPPGPDSGPLFSGLDHNQIRKSHGWSRRSPLAVPRRRKLPKEIPDGV
jgi:hypothetical protein